MVEQYGHIATAVMGCVSRVRRCLYAAVPPRHQQADPFVLQGEPPQADNKADTSLVALVCW